MVKRRREAITRRGAAVVEMAVILPLFLMVILGVLEVTRLGMVAQLLTNASREGCRVASLPGATLDDVQGRVSAVLEGSGIPTPTADPSPANWQTVARGTPIHLELSVPYQEVSWLPTSHYFKSATVSASAIFSSEKP